MERLTEYDHSYESYEVRDGVSFATAINKLAEYEEAEEQGLMIRLPCKLGEACYIVSYNTSCSSHFVKVINEYTLEMFANGVVAFDTKEEAETFLKELEG